MAEYCIRACIVVGESQKRYSASRWNGWRTPVNGFGDGQAGNLYGKTMDGGTGANGTIFEVSPSASGWTERAIYNLDAGYGAIAAGTSE